jgi:AcrR family transcriptional regulator
LLLVPRAFTETESWQIRARLTKAGRETFGRRGLRGTTVDQLARAAGISKGAFYRFFDSKEALLLALVDEDEIAMQAEIEAAIRAEPHRGIDVLVDRSLDAVRADPLIPVLMSPEVLRVLVARPALDQVALLERDVRLVDRVCDVLAEAGVTLTVSRTALLGLLRSLVFVGLHRAEVGEDYVEEMARWLKACLRGALEPVASGEAS